MDDLQELEAGFRDLIDGFRRIIKEQADKILQQQAVIEEYRRARRTPSPLSLVPKDENSGRNIEYPMEERQCETPDCTNTFVGGRQRRFCDVCRVHRHKDAQQRQLGELKRAREVIRQGKP